MLIRIRYILVALVLLVAMGVIVVYKLFRPGEADEAYGNINDAIVSNKQWFATHKRKSRA